MGGKRSEDLLENLLEWNSIVAISARLVAQLDAGTLPYAMEDAVHGLAVAITNYQEAHLGITSHNPY